MISYATYVSSTIHVRLSSQREPGSDAHKALRRCVDVLSAQQSVCWASKRAKDVVDGLIAYMGVVIDGESLEEGCDLLLPDLDIDAIIRTFAREQLPAEASIHNPPPSLNKRDTESAIYGSSTLQSSDTMANDNDLLNEHIIPPNGINMGNIFDPIFGFTGSAFDDIDFGYEGDFM